MSAFWLRSLNTIRLILVCHIFYICKSSISTYRAAVLEHQSFHLYTPIVNLSQGQFVINKNLDIIEENIKIASQQNVDIMVLPEVALYGQNYNYSQCYYLFEEYPSANSNIIACNNSLYNNKPILQRMSCLAKQYNIYLCIHNGDNQKCNKSFQNCTNSNHYQWSTTFVFDNKGQLIAKYIKTHMVPYELNYDQISINNAFDMTFNMTLGNINNKINVTFGLIICMDIEYSRPLIFNYIQQKNIRNIIFSTSYPDEYPKYAILGEMQKRSKTLQINWIGASQWWINNISNNIVTNLMPWSSGTAIFSNGKILNQYYNTNANNIGDKLIIADIPINIKGPNKHIPKLESSYKILNQIPEIYCNNYSIPIKTKPGLIINESIECNYLNNSNNKIINFKCNVNAKISYNSPINENDYLILNTHLNTGNGYFFHDQNNIYYYQQQCIFYYCYNNGLCLDNNAYIYDTNGTTIFEEINLHANYMKNDVMYLNIFDNKGYVYKYINNQTKVNKSTDISNNSENVYAYFKCNDENDVIINFDLEGRSYNEEAVYQSLN